MNDELFQNKQAGIYNKDFFFEAGKIIVQLAKRNQVPTLVALIDIDDFEMLNTSYGTVTADKILELTTELVIDRCRVSDLVAFLGDGKMGLIFYNITSADAKATLESLREIVANKEYLINDEKKQVTVSIGGTIMHSRTNSGGIEALYDQATIAVEAVRRKGSNGVMVY